MGRQSTRRHKLQPVQGDMGVVEIERRDASGIPDQIAENIAAARGNCHDVIVGLNGQRLAFGLPGNPVSHFVCFHLFVAAALRRLTGAEPQNFLRGTLVSGLDDQPNPRETYTPARLDSTGLHPLKWTSSGDVTCLVETNALVRVPANGGSMKAGREVEFLPT